MSKGQVTSFEEFGPYVDVQSTGGVETANGIFLNDVRNISFVFEGASLSYIQVWNYEGSDFDVAKTRVLEIFDLFDERFGGAEVENLEVSDSERLDRGAMELVLDRILGTASDLAERAKIEQEADMTILFDMKPLAQPDGSRLHSLWGYSGRFDTYFVFLFQDTVDAPERRVPANVSLDPL